MCIKLLTEKYSSAKDQLTGMSVAIKKIMKPFSTPVLAKRTYRELKLLKALQHENVLYITQNIDNLVIKGFK
jgi:p38 MAP kinase